MEDLRRESAGYRDKLRTAEARVDELSKALFTARVESTGQLADATDLEYNPDLLDDAEGLSAAVESLVTTKPHLKARRVSGDAGQGVKGEEKPLPTFSSLFAQ
ncbi:hypothetical protein [Mycolicibacterium sp. CR10]|uniref:hypothetical protein n=1 Tax=Mycolicibacterium sp. CR10 TaxID=2562314 RepID=UPI0010BFEF77|nr:hypothetical protein [Mycolicibacterium sp. CR10]